LIQVFLGIKNDLDLEKSQQNSFKNKQTNKQTTTLPQKKKKKKKKQSLLSLPGFAKE
jgi:hypothetical protein